MNSRPDRADVRLEALSRDDGQAVLDLDQWAFAYSLEGLEPETVLDTLEWDRAVAAYVDGPGGPRVAGMNVTLSLDLPVPGGSVPVGALTWVAVHPEHRRRGVLTAMMRAQLAEVRRRGEPVGALFAAEPGIYGRFGYGPAGRLLHLTLGRGVALRDVDGGDDLYLTFEHADVDRHAELLARCDDEARRDRPGWVSRPTRAQRRYLLEDPPALRRDAETLRVLLARAGGPDGELRGYALFRRAMKWEAAGPDGTVRIRALVALDAAARRALWARITDLDLMARVESPPLPPDDPLLHLVDLRATDAHVTDGLWVRLVDVPAALAARRYTSPVDAVLEVRDAFLPENAGRWHLRGGPDGATCDATDAPADVTLDVRDLGSAYLGGESIAAMAAAGLVTELRPGAVAELAAAFGWHVAPWSGFFF